MSDETGKDRRQFDRFDTEVQVYFRVNYDIQTKVEYQVIDKAKELAASRKYSAISKNVSAQGICFTSNHKLNKGDLLLLEVYLPKGKEPIMMQGEVRWSCSKSAQSSQAQFFDTGVKLLTVNGQPVDKTIYFDKDHQIVWSAVLESILGNFRIIASNRNKNSRNNP